MSVHVDRIEVEEEVEEVEQFEPSPNVYGDVNTSSAKMAAPSVSMEQNRLNALVENLFQALFVKNNPLLSDATDAFSPATIQDILDSME